jgi:hypothetical protein
MSQQRNNGHLELARGITGATTPGFIHAKPCERSGSDTFAAPFATTLNNLSSFMGSMQTAFLKKPV